MTRDKLKTEKYFHEFLLEDTERINKFESNIKSGIVPDDRIPAVLGKIFSISLGLTIANYSAGKEMNEIKKQFTEVIKYSKKGWGMESGYVELVWMLSMGILLEINDEDFNQIIELVNTSNIEDFLVDYLIFGKDNNRKTSNKIMFENPYKTVIEITGSDAKNAGMRLKKYLSKEWYRGHKDSYWYNNHKSNYYTYFGYWSFESGALVKILKLDDSSLKGMPYYPYDMVHWADEKNGNA
jgi:hypothetical protein